MITTLELMGGAALLTIIAAAATQVWIEAALRRRRKRRRTRRAQAADITIESAFSVALEIALDPLQIAIDDYQALLEREEPRWTRPPPISP